MSPITGTADAETLTGTFDPDTILARGGDDLAYGWDEADRIFGCEGNDQLYGGEGNDLVQGGDGDDIVQGGGGYDTVQGGAGNDRIWLGTFSAGWGAAYGGTGDDVLTLLSGGQDGATAVLLDGGAGRDTASVFFTAENPYGDVTVDFTGTTRTITSAVPSMITLRGVEQVQVFIATAGHHTVLGGRWKDAVTLTESAGASVVWMGAGADRVTATAGLGNELDGGAGRDLLRLTGNGPLTLVVDDATGTATDGGDTIRGFEAYETVIIGPADVTFGRGKDVLYGGNWDDIGHGGAGNDRLIGRGGADRLYGDDGDDLLAGGAGNDLLVGGAGQDTLQGGPGVDTLDGGAGEDEIRGGAQGAATLWGGEGADRFVFAKTSLSAHLLADFTSGEDYLMLNAQLLQFGPAPGTLAPERFAVGTAVGDLAQFVLIDRADLGETWLTWDPNGQDPAGGSYLILRFALGAEVVSTDILLI